MKNSKKLSLIFAVVLSVLAVSAHATKKAKMPNPNTNGSTAMITPYDDLKWFNPMDGAPIQFAPASGDIFKTPHSNFGKFPGKFVTPEHIHSHSYEAVVISGLMTNPMSSDKGEPVQLKPGSYWYVPANQAHKTACISDTPCVFYIHQASGFDFTPTPNKN